MPWDAIRGHDAPRQQLLAAHRRGRLGHAFLIVGPEGVGKRLFAGVLAQAFLCERPPAPFEPCGACPACRQVLVGSHPDCRAVRTPDDKHELPIDVVRNFCRQLGLKATRGRGTVGIVEDADDFNEESANCFLKTLEEPPTGSLLLLLTTGTERQLPTILSRCQVLRLRPLPEADMRAVLQAHGVQDPAVLDRLVRLGKGCPGQALALNDEALWSFREAFLNGLTSARPDPVSLAAQWMGFVEQAGKETAPQRERATLVIRLVIDFLGSALRTSLEPGAARVGGVEGEKSRRFAARLDPEALLAMLEACNHAGTLNDRKVQLVLVIESLCDKLARVL